MYSGSTYRTPPPTRSLPEAETRLFDLVGKSVGQKTIEARAKLWEDFGRWSASQSLQPTSDAAVLYLCARKRQGGGELAASTLSRYASDISAVGALTTPNWDTEPLSQIARLFRHIAEVPKQAAPISHDAVYTYSRARTTGRMNAVAALMLWKGAMRCADLTGLQVQDVVLVEDRRVILDLWRAKNAQPGIGRTFSDTRFALLAGEAIERIASYVREQLRRPSREALIPFSPTVLLKELREAPGCAEISQHSFRVGALQRLLSLAGKGVLITPLNLRLAARHAAKEQILPEVLMRYLRGARTELAEYLTAEVRADLL